MICRNLRPYFTATAIAVLFTALAAVAEAVAHEPLLAVVVCNDHSIGFRADPDRAEHLCPAVRLSVGARASRPGPRHDPGSNPVTGSAARMRTQPAVPSRSTARFRQWCMP